MSVFQRMEAPFEDWSHFFQIKGALSLSVVATFQSVKTLFRSMEAQVWKLILKVRVISSKSRERFLSVEATFQSVDVRFQRIEAPFQVWTHFFQIKGTLS